MCNYSSLKLERPGKARRVVQLLAPGVLFGRLKVKCIKTAKYSNDQTTIIVILINSDAEEFVWDIYDLAFRTLATHRDVVPPDDAFKQRWHGTLGAILTQAPG